MENKQTAVEWIVSQIAGSPTHYIIDRESVEVKEDRYNLLFNLDIDITPLVEQAKAMEKEQIIEAHFEGWGDAYDYLKDETTEARQAEDYYNETYGKAN